MCIHTLSTAACKELLIMEVPIQQQTTKGDLIAQKKRHRKATQYRGKTRGMLLDLDFLENLYFHLVYVINSVTHDFSLCNIPETRMHLIIASNFDWPRSK